MISKDLIDGYSILTQNHNQNLIVIEYLYSLLVYNEIINYNDRIPHQWKPKNQRHNEVGRLHAHFNNSQQYLTPTHRTNNRSQTQTHHLARTSLIARGQSASKSYRGFPGICTQ